MIDNEELYREWRKWEASSSVVEERQPSERFGELMIDIADNLLKSPKFSRYPIEDREEMRSEAVYKMLKNLHNVDGAKRKSMFSYFTLCAQCAYLTYLRKKYRRMQVMDEYMAYRSQNSHEAPPPPL